MTYTVWDDTYSKHKAATFLNGAMKQLQNPKAMCKGRIYLLHFLNLFIDRIEEGRGNIPLTKTRKNNLQIGKIIKEESIDRKSVV